MISELTFGEVESTIISRGDPRVAEIPPGRAWSSWVAGYWDRPLDGLARVDGRIVWFHLSESLFEPKPNTSEAYWLVELRDEQRAYWGRVRRDFEELCGTHMSYEVAEGAERSIPSLRLGARFAERWCARSDPELSNNPVLGWSVLGWPESRD